MKKFLFTVYATVSLGCFFGKAQVTRSSTIVSQPSIPQTLPLNISQFEVSGKLITQNGYVGILGIPGGQRTGEFGTTARWNSMGNLDFNVTTPNLTQSLNGIRTQTNGRGIAWGHSIPAPGQNNAGVLSNPFIEWIGNSGSNVTPGNLEFKYALSPTGAAAARVPIFTMAPSPSPFAPAICYAENNTLLGQLRAGNFGSFTTNDSWSATGDVTTQNFETYGTRHQFEGLTLNTAIIKDLFTFNSYNAVMDYGSNTPNGARIKNFKFRFFSDPNDFGSIKNIWQSQSKFSNIVLGRQNAENVNASQFYFSLFDGAFHLPVTLL
jgi:hypothetical protein